MKHQERSQSQGSKERALPMIHLTRATLVRKMTLVVRLGIDSVQETPGVDSAKSEEFLKLNPALGTSATTESTSNAKVGATDNVAMPIVPLNPDVATSNTGNSNKTGVTDTVWKPTALDEVKPSGAPGAGPDAPSNVTPAVPEGFQGTSSSNKETAVGDKASSAKDSTAPTGSQETSPAHKGSVAPAIDAITKPTPKEEHSVPDEEANDPHSKMQSKTVRNTESSKPDTTGEAPGKWTQKAQVLLSKADGVAGLVVESTSHKSESKQSTSSKSPETSSSNNGEEKDGKMSHLKEKIKTKLHIGNKDK